MLNLTRELPMRDMLKMQVKESIRSKIQFIFLISHPNDLIQSVSNKTAIHAPLGESL